MRSSYAASHLYCTYFNRLLRGSTLQLMVLFLLAACSLFTGPRKLIAAGPFLWKPVSESQNKLVVLFQSSFRQENVSKIEVIAANTTETAYSVAQAGANGDRLHARFSKPGSQYAAPVSVKLTFKDGSTRVWQIPNPSQRFETYDKGTASTGSTGGGGLDDVLNGISPSPGADTIGPRQHIYVFEQSGTVNIDACLLTYGQAELTVDLITEGKQKIRYMKWQRSNDKDPSPLYVSGKPVAESMTETKPGDWTARRVTIPVTGNKGDKLILRLSGNYKRANPVLKIESNNILRVSE